MLTFKRSILDRGEEQNKNVKLDSPSGKQYLQWQHTKDENTLPLGHGRGNVRPSGQNEPATQGAHVPPVPEGALPGTHGNTCAAASQGPTPRNTYRVGNHHVRHWRSFWCAYTSLLARWPFEAVARWLGLSKGNNQSFKRFSSKKNRQNVGRPLLSYVQNLARKTGRTSENTSRCIPMKQNNQRQ